ncbi:hypothetical protein Tco_1228082 [Tanacetum coccineum]
MAMRGVSHIQERVPEGLVQVARECTFPRLPIMPTLELQGKTGVVGSLSGLKDGSMVYSIRQLYISFANVKFAMCYRARKCSYIGGGTTMLSPILLSCPVMPMEDTKKMMERQILPKGVQHFQELALMCDWMFSKEIDKVEKYVGGLPDTIYGSVMETKPKTTQDAIEFATELMDKKINTWAETFRLTTKESMMTPPGTTRISKPKRDKTLEELLLQ